jgi:hypothetical protein
MLREERGKGTKAQRDKGIYQDPLSALCLCAFVPLCLGHSEKTRVKEKT